LQNNNFTSSGSAISIQAPINATFMGNTISAGPIGINFVGIALVLENNVISAVTGVASQASGPSVVTNNSITATSTCITLISDSFVSGNTFMGSTKGAVYVSSNGVTHNNVISIVNNVFSDIQSSCILLSDPTLANELTVSGNTFMNIGGDTPILIRACIGTMSGNTAVVTGNYFKNVSIPATNLRVNTAIIRDNVFEDSTFTTIASAFVSGNYTETTCVITSIRCSFSNIIVAV
jgi:hypothetical protein